MTATVVVLRNFTALLMTHCQCDSADRGGSCDSGDSGDRTGCPLVPVSVHVSVEFLQLWLCMPSK